MYNNYNVIKTIDFQINSNKLQPFFYHNTFPFSSSIYIKFHITHMHAQHIIHTDTDTERDITSKVSIMLITINIKVQLIKLFVTSVLYISICRTMSISSHYIILDLTIQFVALFSIHPRHNSVGDPGCVWMCSSFKQS